jgi:hypothetical protein
MPEKDNHPIISSFELREKLASQGDQKPLVNIHSGIPSLDMAIENFHDGELIAVSGPTKNGKTLFCQTITRNISAQQYFALWFSYEVTPRGFINCFDGDDLPLFYLPDGLKARSMEWIEGKILEGLKQYNTRVIFIDHLHYLFDLVQKSNVSLTIGSVVRRLKALAVTHKLVIFLLCHTTKPGGEGGELSYMSIRDSSFVSQESDTVFMIQRTGDKTGQLRIEFHRRTGVFNRVIPLVKIGKYFEEQAPEGETEGEYHEGYRKRKRQ